MVGWIKTLGDDEDKTKYRFPRIEGQKPKYKTKFTKIRFIDGRGKRQATF